MKLTTIFLVLLGFTTMSFSKSLTVSELRTKSDILTLKKEIEAKEDKLSRSLIKVGIIENYLEDNNIAKFYTDGWYMIPQLGGNLLVAPTLGAIVSKTFLKKAVTPVTLAVSVLGWMVHWNTGANITWLLQNQASYYNYLERINTSDIEEEYYSLKEDIIEYTNELKSSAARLEELEALL